MKKIFLLGAFVCFIGSVNAATVTESIFYGTKANNSISNPCKGNTTSICAKIKVTTELLNPMSTLLYESIIDDNGIVKATVKRIVLAPINEVNAEVFRVHSMKGATITVSETEDGEIED